MARCDKVDLIFIGQGELLEVIARFVGWRGKYPTNPCRSYSWRRQVWSGATQSRPSPEHETFRRERSSS